MKLLKTAFITIFIPMILLGQGDLRLRFPESNINNGLQALIGAKALSYSQYGGGFGLDNYVVNITAASIDFSSGGSFNISTTLKADANVNLTAFNFDISGSGTVNFTGNITIEQNGDGYCLLANPTNFSLNVPNFPDDLEDYIEDIVNDYLENMPDIKLSSFTLALPDIIAGYFESPSPTIQVLDDEIIVSLQTDGPKFVTVQNDFDGNNNVSQIEALESTQWNSYGSPKRFAWDENTNHSVRALDDIEAYSSSDYKFWEWEDESKILQKDIYVDGDNTYASSFKKVQPVTVGNDLGGMSDGGSISFEGTSHSSPYSDYAFMAPRSSALAVANQQTVSVNSRSVTWNFQNWEDGSTNLSRDVSPSSSQTYTATYKGHLASDNSLPTGYNNGRRLARDINGGLHMVYEDNGEIWYTYSSNNGSSWSAEVRISDTSDDYHSFRNPSIDIGLWPVSYDIYIHVLFETVFNSTILQRDQHIITYTYKINTDGEWVATTYPAGNIFGGGVFSSPEGERPVFVTSENSISAAWKNPLNNKIAVINKDRYTNWSSVFEINGSNGYPTIAQGSNTHIIWKSGDYLKHVQGDAPNDWSSVHTLATGYQYNLESPSITFNNAGKLCVTWPAVHQGYGYKELYYQEYTIGTGTPQTYGNQVILYTYSAWNNPRGNPSIGNDPAGIINVFYEDSYSTLWSKKKSASSWSTYYYSTGSYPNAADNAPRSASWTKYSSAPYFVKTYYPPSGLSKTTVTEADSMAERPAEVKQRLEYVLSDNKTDPEFISLQLQNTSLNGVPISFDKNKKSDILQMKGADNITMHFKNFKKNLKNKDKDNTILFSVYFVTDKERKLLETYRVSDFIDAPDSLAKSFFYSALNGAEGYLELSFDDNEPFIVDVLQDAGQVMDLPKKTDLAFNPEVIPEKYELDQNYPNPFNPITHIQFGIPENAHVDVSVYNTQGKKVASLMNGYQQAGSYEVVFDGSGLSSGLYFYRLQAGSYSQVKRMLYVK